MPDRVRTILDQVAAGQTSPDQAAAMLRLGDEHLEFATLDHDRADRCGAAEVVFAQGKTAEQVVAIARRLVDRSGHALVTRADDPTMNALRDAFDEIAVAPRAGAALIGQPPPPRGTSIPVVTAGTSDEPVAEEAVLTCAALGQPNHRVTDVGVAGVHRLLDRSKELRRASVVICIAGMEGALPSVVAGLIDVPVIAVPTSVGYGLGAGGFAALAGMLTSCASGVSVVNIDNGFGAAFVAASIQRQVDRAAGLIDQ